MNLQIKTDITFLFIFFLKNNHIYVHSGNKKYDIIDFARVCDLSKQDVR